jgi:anti-sigma B factor antagonist
VYPTAAEVTTMAETAPPSPGADHSGAIGTSDYLDTTIERPSPDTAVLVVRGEIDTLTAGAFTAAVTELMDGPGASLVIDLTDVTFLASSGLATLITAANKAEERGVRLRLVAASRAVHRPLEITGTDQLFDIHPDVASATAASD